MFIQFLKLAMKIFFREITVRGVDDLPESGPVIFTPNHPNALIDPILLFFLPPVYKIRFVAKAPLFRIPLLGWILRKMQAIPVVRRFEADGKVDYNTFFSACVDALAAGGSISIFPEGVSRPQPYMADMRTGAARLFFMAHERNIDVKIVPVGLNYEHGSIFRSSVVIWAGQPLDTEPLEKKHQDFPQIAVRELTDKIKKSLEKHVFQTENYRDRDLMLLLERIYNPDKNSAAWSERFERLKQFENSLNVIKDSCADGIESLREAPIRYAQLTKSLERMEPSRTGMDPVSPTRLFLALAGFPLATVGWLLNILPYQLCNLIVKHIKKSDEAVTATYKVTYSMLLFPLTYVLEAVLVYIWFGGIASILFAALIIPLSYFTVRYYEWVHEGGVGRSMSSSKLARTLSNRFLKQQKVLHARIHALVDELATKIDLPAD
ncbi:hypothetical protein D3OALGA1CA_5746 [Olavius algarvensis associated proteobacterium Delta 3]|nr:hypothetical protein D3OALGB2SA_2428 [Olavius algarvensis associated proteobacterium Delta 3]CAB5171190.1 hypothetical protein D3OALGA1CA_5746 [Olavius algarvensis associated proteobacterium Delta 3]